MHNGPYNCTKLTAVTIPASVEYIYQQAFARCDALQSVNAQPTTPPFLYDNSFTNYDIPLNVPEGCKEAYAAAQGWSNFSTINDGNVYYQLAVTTEGHGTATYGETEVSNETRYFEVREGSDVTRS